jgi:hypothetical protein
MFPVMSNPPKSQAFLAWKECLRANRTLRNHLSVPQDDEEDHRMCRERYTAYMCQNNKKNVHIGELR